jgi:acyl-CoA thioesterase II
VSTDDQLAFDRLITEVIPVRPCGDDRFQGGEPGGMFKRIYGGEIVAQGLYAAGHTVDSERQAHSLHVNYLRSGSTDSPTSYSVERVRDSPDFSTRLVKARQGTRLIATMTASFQVPQPGLEHSLSAELDASVAAPESLMTRADRVRAVFGSAAPSGATSPWPIDMRYIDHDPWTPSPLINMPTNRMWIRADGSLGDDPLMHVCVLAFASDLTMFEPVIDPHGGPPSFVTWETVYRGGARGASLDHTIWFHRPFRADRWMLHEHESPIAHGSRGLATGRFFTPEGVLVATVAQEIAMFVNQPVVDEGVTE